MKNIKSLLTMIAFVLTTVAMQTSANAQQANDPKFNKMMKDGFKAKGIAGLDRIQQDETQKFCSDPKFSESKAGEPTRLKLQKLNMAGIQQPSDGVYVGDWKKGEAIAQSGRGATWTDSADTVVGGGCYNCHQIDKKEISYGTIGPTLWNYGKLRGYSNEVVLYTWNRISNSEAYNACSDMPRFAHFKLLNEQQIRDLVALLLDPNSPVNQ